MKGKFLSTQLCNLHSGMTCFDKKVSEWLQKKLPHDPQTSATAASVISASYGSQLKTASGSSPRTSRSSRSSLCLADVTVVTSQTEQVHLPFTGVDSAAQTVTLPDHSLPLETKPKVTFQGSTQLDLSRREDMKPHVESRFTKTSLVTSEV